ncbi:ribonuclease z [Fusarium sporotrichioides]|uniref:ribonuclease Z n=1 Tax=Fusarium sporotrichioides TaxID=5514 RepID=A0A395SSW2_FUSSP|nr:ribonuclease z [Fusarium sporotrichioides]
MSTSIEIASAPTVDTPGTCLLVHTDKRSYVFGRPEEGTQRAFQSSKIRMGATEHVFLSGTVSWQQVGGLFGYILTVGGVLDASREQEAVINKQRKEKGLKALKESPRQAVHIHGGENLNHTLASCRPVILRQPITVKTHEHRENPRLDTIKNLEPDWKDDSLRVWKIPIQRERSSSPKKRRRSSSVARGTPDSSEPQFKEFSRLSNPEYAATVIEKIMFNGTLYGIGTLVPVKLKTVKPEDTVFWRENSDIQLYKGPRPGDSEFKDNDETVWLLPSRGSEEQLRNTYPNLAHRPLPPTIYSQTSMCYLVKCLPRRGKFDAKKAKELQVPVGDYKKLIAGQTIKTEAGVTVTPEMIVGPEMPGPGFIVADIESHDLIDSFMERPEWSNPELMTDVVAMYWILGPGLAGDARIQKFVDEHPTLKHFFCAKDTCPNMISLAGPAQLQTKLRVIDHDRFNLLKFDNHVRGTLPSGSQVESGRTGNKITLMPRLRFNDGTVTPFINLLETARSVSDDIKELAQQAYEKTSDHEFLRKLEEDEKDIPNRDTEIIPLGTGSSMPGKYRNVSSTLIRVPGIGNYLLDVGEGTLGQIRRLFGEEETGNILRDLKCIVISHLHADHHLGTPILIKAWYEHNINDSNAKLAISCVSRYKALLEEVSQVEDFGFHRLYFPHAGGALPDKQNHGRCELKDNTFGLKAITRVPVPHCWLAMATELELTSGLRIAYSGDCRPSMDFARACQGAHLLIHECTFDDDMLSHAKKKMHSTMGEALDVAREMKARKTLLTHFSQRYVKSDSLKEEKRDESGDVLMAFDHMNVRLGDFRKAAAYQPAIAKLLAQTDDKDDKEDK